MTFPVVAAQTNCIDRRNVPRQMAFGNPFVRITASDREPLTACVWDISRAGACLIFPAAVHVPAVFKIDFDNIPRQAPVMWHQETFVGVRFRNVSSAPEVKEWARTNLRIWFDGRTDGGDLEHSAFFSQLKEDTHD